MDIVRTKDFTYSTSTSLIPFDPSTKENENLLVLLIKDTTQCIEILDNKKIKRQRIYQRYYKPSSINVKVFTTVVKKKATPSEISDFRVFLRTMELMHLNSLKEAKGKNAIFDVSQFNQTFFDHCEGKNLQLILDMYLSMLKQYLDNHIPDDYTHRYLIMNTSDWGISSTNMAAQFASVLKVLNPLSIFYYIMKHDPEKLKTLGNYTMVILDSKYGWLKFDIQKIDDESHLKLHAALQKFKSDDVTIKDPEANHSAEVASSGTSSSDEDKDEEDDEVYHGGSEDSEQSEEDKYLQAISDIEVNDEKSRRSIKSTKRDQELREAQKKIKIDNITLGDVDRDVALKDTAIEETDLADKIISPHKNIKKVKFDNFNESYQKKQMKKDIASIFDCMKDKSSPVYVRKIEVVDSSDAMNLKETWKVQLEGEDRVRHSVTIDVPKIYDKNYLYLGGNRKEINNQITAIPVIKIGPTTVQVCTNFNKVFMYRYGEILSPKVTVFKKIILNNPELFEVKRGNGLALNGNTRTTIEYDSLAKDFLEIHIKGTSYRFRFDQTFYSKMVKEGKLKEAPDKYLYVLYDEAAKDIKTRGVCINTDYSTQEDSGNDEVIGIINLFTSLYEKKTGKNFWDLAGEKDKPGKRFMYTRCKIMEKFIPTILLLSYWEGLSTVLRKAGIKCEFTDKRTKIGIEKGRIEFANGFLVFEREPTEHSLLMNGLALVDTKSYNYEDFDSKDIYLNIFDALYNSRILGGALDGYYDNLIDPKTYMYLKSHNYPTDIVSLMIFANALLADNNYISELDMSIYRIRNLEVIYATMYKIIARAYGEYKRTSMNANPVKISVPKNELLKQLLTSNIVEDYSVINPITEKEKLHTATRKGPSGTNLERSYTEEKRCFDKSMTGLIGMSTSPDANCGVQRELTIEPKILDTLGTIDTSKPIKEMNDHNLFTYAESLTPNGVMRDDAIRTSMATKQS